MKLKTDCMLQYVTSLNYMQNIAVSTDLGHYLMLGYYRFVCHDYNNAINYL